MTTALYPGSFDPVTNGHIDIATRAAAIFDKLIIGVFASPPKHLLFSTEERVEMMKEAVAHLLNVEVTAYSGLTVSFAKKIGTKVVVRGLRMGSDFEQEFSMAQMNRKMAPDIEVVCLMSSRDYQFVSASLLKEAAEFGAYIDELVPKHVAEALRKKFSVKIVQQ